MPSNRRVKVFFVFILTVVIVTLFITSSHRAIQNNEFYERTSAALEKGRGGPPPKVPNMGADGESLARDTAQRVQDAAKAAKDSANKKALRPETPDEVVGMGNSAEGNRVGSTAGDRNVAGKKKYSTDDEVQKVVKEEEEDPEGDDDEVEAELNTILKRSPIIIFSKTYCPYSKRAKGILLNEYSIVPAPYVVELDEHPMGAALQEHLYKRTGRKTVPNILINGKSIGGSDEIAELASKKELIGKIKTMGGKRMVEVAQRAD